MTSALAAGVRGLGKLITAAGGLREGDLAREVGVPPWKLKTMRAQARGWDAAGLARALKAVAVADADIKGAADDASFALERMVLTVSGPAGASPLKSAASSAMREQPMTRRMNPNGSHQYGNSSRAQVKLRRFSPTALRGTASLARMRLVSSAYHRKASDTATA